MDSKSIKAMLMAAACQLASAAIIRTGAAGPAAVPVVLDPTIGDGGLRNLNLAAVHEVEIYYSWLLAAHQSSGVNDVFKDPTSGGPPSPPAPPAPTTPTLPAPGAAATK